MESCIISSFHLNIVQGNMSLSNSSKTAHALDLSPGSPTAMLHFPFFEATCRGKRGQELTMPPDPEIADSNPPTEEDVDTYQDKQPADHAKDKEKLASIEEADEEGGDQEDDLKADAAEVARCLTVTTLQLW